MSTATDETRPQPIVETVPVRREADIRDVHRELVNIRIILAIMLVFALVGIVASVIFGVKVYTEVHTITSTYQTVSGSATCDPTSMFC